MSNAAIWSMDAAPEGLDMTFSLFDRLPADGSRAAPDLGRREPAADVPRRAAKAFKRLLGHLSLADLNEYREAAGREPELDARALTTLNEAADRFFPVRSDESGGRFLRNAYLKYMSEKMDLSDLAQRPDRPHAGFE